MTHLRVINPQDSHDTHDDGPPLTVAEAAIRLGYSRAKMYELIKKRLIGCHRPPGADIKIYPHHIAAFQRAYECPALNSSDQSTGSQKGPASASGTSPGPQREGYLSIHLKTLHSRPA